MSLRNEFHSNYRTNFFERVWQLPPRQFERCFTILLMLKKVLGRNSEDQSWPRNQTPAAFTSWSAAWPAQSWAWAQRGSSSLTLLCSRWSPKFFRLRGSLECSAINQLIAGTSSAWSARRASGLSPSLRKRPTSQSWIATPQRRGRNPKEMQSPRRRVELIGYSLPSWLSRHLWDIA